MLWAQLAIRLLEALFGLIAAALLGSAKHDAEHKFYRLFDDSGDGTFTLFRIVFSVSSVNFFIFVGASSVILAAFWAAMLFVPVFRRRIALIIELVVATIWAIFWLAAISALPAKNAIFKSSCSVTACKKAKAGWAFGFLSLLLWIGNIVMLLFNTVQHPGSRDADVGYPKTELPARSQAAPVSHTPAATKPNIAPV